MEPLTIEERKVLTAIDGASVNGVQHIADQLQIPAASMKRIIATLAAAGFIDRIALQPHIAIYSHTRKVTRGMLDEETHYRFGDRPLHTYAGEKP
jgi:DNA-binding IclR family transcriptional regulator